jgi:hypothetical protein
MREDPLKHIAGQFLKNLSSDWHFRKVRQMSFKMDCQMEKKFIFQISSKKDFQMIPQKKMFSHIFPYERQLEANGRQIFFFKCLQNRQNFDMLALKFLERLVRQNEDIIKLFC